MTSRLFYQTRLPRPELDRAEGIYLWSKEGRRYLNAHDRLVNIAYERGLIITEDGIDELMELLIASLDQFADEAGLGRGNAG